MPNIEAIFNRYNTLVGTLGGDLFNIYRPNYSQVDNTPELIIQNVKFRCDPASLKLAEPRYAGVQYYDIFGPRHLVQSGDILQRACGDSMTPPITISTFFPVKALVGFRSSHIGYIEYAETASNSEILYQNVYFEFLNESYAGAPLNRQLPDSVGLPEIKVILFTRLNVKFMGSHLVEQFGDYTTTDPDGNVTPYVRKWLIEAIDQSGPEMILSLSIAG